MYSGDKKRSGREGCSDICLLSSGLRNTISARAKRENYTAIPSMRLLADRMLEVDALKEFLGKKG